MSKERLVIAVDFDNTIAASSEAVFKLYQKDTGNYSSRYTDNHQWNFEWLIPKAYIEKALGYFNEQRFYDILEPKKGSVEALRFLSKNNEVIIVTKHDPDGVSKKAQWIRNYLPFINRVVFLDQDDYKKNFIMADIYIDDKPECLIGNNGYKILFGDYGYQREYACDPIMKAGDWREALFLYEILEKEIKY